MTEKIKTVIGCHFLLPDFKSRGQPMSMVSLVRVQIGLGWTHVMSIHRKYRSYRTFENELFSTMGMYQSIFGP